MTYIQKESRQYVLVTIIEIMFDLTVEVFITESRRANDAEGAGSLRRVLNPHRLVYKV